MPAPFRVLIPSVLAAGLVLVACAPGTPGAPVPAPGPAPVSTAPVSTAPTSTPPASTTPAPSPAAVPVPAPNPAPVTTQAPALPLAGRTVVLDPGHNGGNSANRAAIDRQVPDGRGGTKACNTTGTATDAGYPEHAFTWDLALRVRTELQDLGAEVVLTRSSDTGVGPCVDERGAAGAKAGADLMVSLHADGSAPADSGFHVAYSAPPLNPAQSGPALVLARDLRDALAAAGFPLSDYIGRAGLSPRSDLAGLNLATVPTALVEFANMRNAKEALVLSSADGRQRYADAVAAGVTTFLKS